MANVVTRRLCARHLFKMKELTNFTKHSSCTSVFFVNFKCNDGVFLHNRGQQKPLHFIGNIRIQPFSDKPENKEKLSLFQRFKQMYKDYWYVLVPVHLVTSAAWFGGFYYMAKSGVDIVGMLESMNISDRIINPLRDSTMGYIAVSYALYKIATPLRYTVTLGGTTIAINYLQKWGLIKPVPSTERLKEIYLEKKDNLIESMRETKQGFKQSEKKKDQIAEDVNETLNQIKGIRGKQKQKDDA